MDLVLGEMRITRVPEMDCLPLPPNALFPTCERRFWDEAKHIVNARTVDVERDLILTSMHSFVLRSGGRTILVDTCNGDHKPRTGFAAFANMLESDYLNNLKRAGVRPQDVDIVFCTHFHFDHIGWNTQLDGGRWVPTFPRARYLFNRTELDHFARLLRETPEFSGINSFEDSILPIISAGQADVLDSMDGYELAPGLTLEAAPGHTPGHTMLHASTIGGTALFTGDVIHHPIQFLDPLLALAEESDSAQSLATRRALIERCVDQPIWLMTGHFAAPSAGRVIRNGSHIDFRYQDE